MFRSALYLVMAVLQLIAVCLATILCASNFAFRPMLATFFYPLCVFRRVCRECGDN